MSPSNKKVALYVSFSFELRSKLLFQFLLKSLIPLKFQRFLFPFDKNQEFKWDFY